MNFKDALNEGMVYGIKRIKDPKVKKLAQEFEGYDSEEWFKFVKDMKKKGYKQKDIDKVLDYLD